MSDCGEYDGFIGRKLRMTREKRKARLEDVAACTGISRTRLHTLEKGGSPVRPFELCQLVQHYKITLNWLFGLQRKS